MAEKIEKFSLTGKIRRRINKLSSYSFFNNPNNGKGLNMFSSKFTFYLGASLLGGLRGGVGLIVEHPLESIKTQWQDKYTVKSSREIVRSIYSEKGFLGFYRGFIPNFIRVTSKQLYRWPLMLFFPRFFEKNIPQSIKQRFDGAPKICCGLAIANIEIFIITPLDRLKVYFMTTSSSKGKGMFYQFYNTHRGHFFRELCRGLEPSFWRQNVSWVSFLYLDFKVKKLFKKFRNKQSLNILDFFLISIIVGSSNLLAGK
jgi:hypothetical protein